MREDGAWGAPCPSDVPVGLRTTERGAAPTPPLGQLLCSSFSLLEAWLTGSQLRGRLSHSHEVSYENWTLSLPQVTGNKKTWPPLDQEKMRSDEERSRRLKFSSPLVVLEMGGPRVADQMTRDQGTRGCLQGSRCEKREESMATCHHARAFTSPWMREETGCRADNGGPMRGPYTSCP